MFRHLNMSFFLFRFNIFFLSFCSLFRICTNNKFLSVKNVCRMYTRTKCAHRYFVCAFLFFFFLLLSTGRRHAVIYTIRTQTHENWIDSQRNEIETTEGIENKRIFDFFFLRVVRFNSFYWWSADVIQRISFSLKCFIFVSNCQQTLTPDLKLILFCLLLVWILTKINDGCST